MIWFVQAGDKKRAFLLQEVPIIDYSRITASVSYSGFSKSFALLFLKVGAASVLVKLLRGTRDMTAAVYDVCNGRL